MSFSFNNAIPAANNDPSVDQPDMLINNQSTESILAVDHISFNTANGGQHQQVTFNNKNTPAAQTDPQSVLYTGSGSASTVSQLFYRNQNGIFQISPIKAWGYAGTGGIIASQAVNATVARDGPGVYTVTMPANTVSSVNYAVFATAASTSGLVATSQFISITQFFLIFTGVLLGRQDPTTFSFQVLQL